MDEQDKQNTQNPQPADNVPTQQPTPPQPTTPSTVPEAGNSPGIVQPSGPATDAAASTGPAVVGSFDVPVKKSKKLPIVLVVVVLVLLGGGALAYTQLSNNEDPVPQATEQHDHEQTQTQLTPRETILAFIAAFKAGDKAKFDSLMNVEAMAATPGMEGKSAYDMCLASPQGPQNCPSVLNSVDTASITDDFKDQSAENGKTVKVLEFSQKTTASGQETESSYYFALAEEDGAYKVTGFGLSGINSQPAQ